MVLSEELTSAVKYDEEGVVEAVHTWLQNLSRPEDINDVDEKGATVLILCIVAGGIRGGQDDEDTHTNYLTAIRWLLRRGADVTIADQRGWTPLHRACNTFHKFGRNIIPQLLAAGADIDAKPEMMRMTPLSISIDHFRCCAGTDSDFGIDQSFVDEERARTALEYVSTLIRYGASIDNCWDGPKLHHAETWMRALEDRTGNEVQFYTTPAARVLKENNHWVACKALIKEVRVAPRKEVLLLRALAIKGRAKTADPILNFVVNGLPDGVAWNVLSFWRVERKKIVPSWGYYDLGALDTPAMAALTTQTEIQLNQAKLRGVRDAESQMCRYLSHAIEQLEVSESSTQG